MFNGSNDYFSVDYSQTYYSNIYKHNQPNFQEYYGVKYPHTIDFVVNNNPLEVKTTQNITYTSKTSLFDDLTNQ